MKFTQRVYHLVAGRLIRTRLLAKSQYWSMERMNEYQLERLHTLLSEAGAQVPYYQEMFKRLGFDPLHDLKRPGDISALPLLTKPMARELGDLLRNPRPDIGYITERTSGSTGEPFVERISDKQMAFEKAAVWRHWSWAGYRFRDNVAIVRTYVPEEGQPLIKDDPLRNFRYYSAYHMDDASAESYVHDMLKWKPRFLRGYPSSLEILADTVARMGVTFQGMKGLFTASETLTDGQRQKLTSVFGAEVFDWYGLAEQVVSANECQEHQGMHLNLEYGIWELEKRPYLADNERMIVGTNLNNIAMPLIRYETGDIAVVSDNPEELCPCGRTLPLIKQIRGRKDDILTAIGGRPVPSVNFYSLFREYDSIKRFQLIQKSLNDVELRYVSENTTEEEINDICQELVLRLGKGMSIHLKRTDQFLTNAIGKRRPVISLIGLSDKAKQGQDVSS